MLSRPNEPPRRGCAPRGDWAPTTQEGDPSRVIRETAATMAGLSEHQRESALRVVNMPPEALTTKNDTNPTGRGSGLHLTNAP